MTKIGWITVTLLIIGLLGIIARELFAAPVLVAEIGGGMLAVGICIFLARFGDEPAYGGKPLPPQRPT